MNFAAAEEKRREPRQSAHGPVRIHFDNPQSIEIQGQLVDVSASGFRMSHAYSSLEAGQTVNFLHAGAKGVARVMWNRILDRAVETGFLVVSK
ncbi:MAG: PilZ domain-containing protein [Bryobacteraceae bacterium]